MNPATKLFSYIKESKAELKKVIWPNKKETTNSTIMVIVFSVAVAAFLGATDAVLSWIFQFFI